MKDTGSGKGTEREAAIDAILSAPDLPIDQRGKATPITGRRIKQKAETNGKVVAGTIAALNEWDTDPAPDTPPPLRPHRPFDSANPADLLATTVNPAYLADTPYSPDEPWGHMEGESDLHYLYFCHYRSLGLARTKIEVARHFSITPTQIYKVAADHDWENRTRAYDLWRETQYQAELMQQTRDMAGIHATVAAKGIHALSSIFEALVRRIQEDPENVLSELDEYSASHLLKLAQDSARVIPSLMNAERLSRGLPTELVATVSRGEMAVTVRSSDELAEILATIAGVQPSATLIDGRVVEGGDGEEDLANVGGGEASA